MANKKKSAILQIKIKKISPDAQIPKYSHEGDAGMDLISVENVVIEPKHRVAVRTGLQVELPNGYEMQIRPKSGLALTKGITVLNTPGTIDSEYRGEIRVILINFSSNDYYVEKGDKIAQAVINKFERLKIEESKELSVTERGEKGFGSTGK